MKLKICRFLSAALVMVMLTGLGTAFAVFSEWSVRVEAEDGVMTGTVRTENVIGDSGRTVSFIDNGPANSLELQVTPQGGTDYIMKLRYRSGAVRDLLYQINGGPNHIQTPLTLIMSGYTSLFQAGRRCRKSSSPLPRSRPRRSWYCRRRVRRNMFPP